MNFELKNVNLIYEVENEGGTPALSDVSLNVQGTGLVGILGPSGSGKSSLLYTMAGLKQPTSGVIEYEGTDLASLSPSDLASLRRKNFGFIFQQHFLIKYMTVLENVLVPLNQNNAEVRKQAKYLLKRLGIEQHANKYPHQLSGGQRQRVAIARALMNKPKVIFGDEPTAALDFSSAQEVMSLLSEYTKDTLVVIVTHDVRILKNAKSLIHVKDGKIEKVTLGKGGTL